MLRRWFLISIVSAICATLGIVHVAGQGDERLDLNRIRRATVFVIQVGGSNLEMRCVGTGTLVRFDGLILTNAHHVVQSDSCSGDDLIIAMALNPDEPPVPKYRARLAQVDEGLDLALLRIDRELDGREIEQANLPVLPFVPVATSNAITLDETFTLVGYPDLGNQGTRIVRATAVSFMAEPSGGEQSWVKVATIEGIPGLMSGGGAYNQAGELIGVPTSAPIQNEIGGGQCLSLEDSNGDGFINRSDRCVPVSDAISVVRPIGFARPLIRSAALGLVVENLTAPPSRTVFNDAPSVSRLFFATSVNNRLPNQVIGSASAGTTSLYLFFDYVNFTKDTVYEVRVSVDGVPSQTFSLPPVRWSGNDKGLWYVGSSGQPWSNGRYEFRIVVNGLVADSIEITVGGTPTEAPSFSNIAFGLLDENDNLRGGYVLPTGDVASTRFIYTNMTAGIPWQSAWYFNGVAIPNASVRNIWSGDDGENGTRDDVSIRPQGGLLPGNYRVDVALGDPPRFAITGDFVVAGAPGGILPLVFSNIEFYRAENSFSAPSAMPSTSFPDGANTLYAQFDWQQIARGTLWTMQWLVDDAPFYEETLAWNADESGQDFQLRLSAPNGIPEGTYRLNLLINGVLLESAEVVVGIGQLEINRLEEVGGVQLGGSIVDADTQEGIVGATFILISEDYSIADFAWLDEQIYALAISDQDGRFEIDRSLALDAPYSVYVIAEGFLPITQDGFLINAENLAEAGGSPLDIVIPLTKD